MSAILQVPLSYQKTLYTIINQYSLVVVGFLILMAIAIFSWRFVGKKYMAALSGLTLVLLITLQMIFSTDANTYKDLSAIDNAITSGNPTLLVFYSDL